MARFDIAGIYDITYRQMRSHMPAPKARQRQIIIVALQAPPTRIQSQTFAYTRCVLLNANKNPLCS